MGEVDEPGFTMVRLGAGGGGSARRVLPISPGPTRVTTGAAVRVSATASSSGSRPISRSHGGARLSRRISYVRSGGCLPSPSWTTACSATTPVQVVGPQGLPVGAVGQRTRRGRQQVLTAVAGVGGAGRGVHGRAEVAP